MDTVEDEIELYESLKQDSVRPALSSFLEDSMEFYRWYEFGGKARPEPLTREQLADVMKMDLDDLNSVTTAKDWDWFKGKKLGVLRGPIEALQRVVEGHATLTPEWDAARDSADWCATAKKPVADELFVVLDDLVGRATQNVGVEDQGVPGWFNDIVIARNAVMGVMVAQGEASLGNDRAQFRCDIPNEAWLEEKREEVLAAGKNEFRVPRWFGPITGWFDRDLNLPVEFLGNIKGERGEQSAIREDSLDYIRGHWDEVKGTPLYVEIDPFGKPWVNEGNHRIMVALEKGIESLPTNVRYFSGGELLSGDWAVTPGILVNLDARILQLDKDCLNNADSLSEAKVIASQKGNFFFADSGTNRDYVGHIMGVTDGHVVQSLGRSAVIYDKASLDKVPEKGEAADISFRSGKGMVSSGKSLAGAGVER